MNQRDPFSQKPPFFAVWVCVTLPAIIASIASTTTMRNSQIPSVSNQFQSYSPLATPAPPPRPTVPSIFGPVPASDWSSAKSRSLSPSKRRS